MTSTPPRLAVLDADAAEPQLDALADILVDAVAGGASVSFMAPFGRDDALAYWRGLLPAVRAGRVVLLGAFLADRLAGTAQLHLATPANQPHRGEVAKLLVHRRARRRGLATALMRRLEDEARARGRTLLTLDTIAGGDAERLYPALGWVRVGVIPGYARFPDGPLGDTVIFYKALPAA